MRNIVVQIYRHLTKTERHLFRGFLSVLAISGIMWAILTFQTSTIETPAYSDRYKEGIIGQPITINPVIIGSNDTDKDLAELLFEDLADIAENYKISNNGQVWNIILKSDLRWSDGKPLTSDDVIFTIDTIQNPDSRSPLLQTWQGVIVDRISEKELEFTLRTPYAFFLENLKGLKIIPKHIFSVIPSENFRISNFNLEPVGNGPYKFQSFEKKKDGFITDYHLVANEYYAKKAPFIKKFDVKFYPSGIALLDAFNRNKIDGFGGLNYKRVKDIKLGHLILETITPQYYAIFLNQNAKPSLGDKRVRKAINLAVNKKEIISRVFDNKAISVNQPILPILDGYEKLADSDHEFSLEKAAGALDESGWIINPETGWREKKVGKQIESLTFSVIVPQVSFLVETVEILKEDLAKIGVTLNPVILNPTDIANEVLKTRNYEMIIFGNTLRNNPDIYSFWHSSQRFYPGLNLALYEKKEADALMEAIRKNPKNVSRQEALTKLQKIIIDDQPAIFLYSPLYLYVGPKNLGGAQEKIINTPSDRFENVNNWYLETTRVFK